MRNLRLPLLVTLILLSGCVAKAPASIQIKGGEITNPCDFIALAQYDQAFNLALEAEIAAAPPTAIWPKAISDYHILRKAVAACTDG